MIAYYRRRYGNYPSLTPSLNGIRFGFDHVPNNDRIIKFSRFRMGKQCKITNEIVNIFCFGNLRGHFKRDICSIRISKKYIFGRWMRSQCNPVLGQNVLPYVIKCEEKIFD